MKLSFFGASRQVTGSCYLLELDNDFRILIDCGSDLMKGGTRPAEGLETEPWMPKEPWFAFDASLINMVILTHAHIDHSGELPNLVRMGFEGQIVCTAPTFELSKLLLMDSASLNRRKLNRYTSDHKKKGSGRHTQPPGTPIPEGLYLEKSVEDTYDNFVTVQPKVRHKVTQGVYLTLIPAGHLLGAVSVMLEVETPNGFVKIGFSGDLGRKNYPLLEDPYPFPEVDYLICETTYGSRGHRDKGDPVDILEDIIRTACIERTGPLVIPAFSVGRSQALFYILNKLYMQRDIPPIKVFADSPLALSSTRVYQKYYNWLNSEAKEFAARKEDLFDFENLTYVEDAKESKSIKDYRGPHIIVSSSGMVSGGRVEYHVKNNIGNSEATILMVGFAAEGTLGHDLLHHKGILEFKGKEMKVTAQVKSTDIFSGHGDQTDLLEFVGYQKPEKLKGTFLVHGEPDSMVAFAGELQKRGYQNVVAPIKGQTFELV